MSARGIAPHGARITWRPVHPLPPSAAQDARIEHVRATVAIRQKAKHELVCLFGGSIVARGRTMSECKSRAESYLRWELAA